MRWMSASIDNAEKVTQPMMYSLHELHKSMMTPAVLWAGVLKETFTSPFNPLSYTPMSRTVAANSELFARLMRRYHKPEWGIDHVVIDGHDVAVSEEAAMERPFCRLVHFRKPEKENQPKTATPGPHNAKRRAGISDIGKIKIPGNYLDRLVEKHRAIDIGFGYLVNHNNGQDYEA